MADLRCERHDRAATIVGLLAFAIVGSWECMECRVDRWRAWCAGKSVCWRCRMWRTRSEIKTGQGLCVHCWLADRARAVRDREAAR